MSFIQKNLPSCIVIGGLSSFPGFVIMVLVCVAKIGACRLKHEIIHLIIFACFFRKVSKQYHKIYF